LSNTRLTDCRSEACRGRVFVQ